MKNQKSSQCHIPPTNAVTQPRQFAHWLLARSCCFLCSFFTHHDGSTTAICPLVTSQECIMILCSFFSTVGGKSSEPRQCANWLREQNNTCNPLTIMAQPRQSAHWFQLGDIAFYVLFLPIMMAHHGNLPTGPQLGDIMILFSFFTPWVGHCPFFSYAGQGMVSWLNKEPNFLYFPRAPT